MRILPVFVGGSLAGKNSVFFAPLRCRQLQMLLVFAFRGRCGHRGMVLKWFKFNLFALMISLYIFVVTCMLTGFEYFVGWIRLLRGVSIAKLPVPRIF